MNQVLDPSLALTNKLGGAVAFVVYTAESTNARQYIPLDQEGRSASFRMAWFISKLLGSTGVMERLSHQRQVSTYCSLSLFAEIANDCIGMSSINLPWVLVDGQPEPQTVNFVYELEALLAKYRRSENSREFVLDGQRQLLLKASGRSVSSYYHARAYASAASQLAEVIELEISAEARVRFSQIRKTNDPIADAAFVVEPVDMRTKALLCSELVSDVTGWEYATDPKDGLLTVL